MTTLLLDELCLQASFRVFVIATKFFHSFAFKVRQCGQFGNAHTKKVILPRKVAIARFHRTQ
ncbi:hypothetical protein OGM63_22385 [Plectonema radiosum NIES-515]|uniref:Transposase n=1 Tax=Plectonema radiosum NIES-515 TaxID=2986073 RepID=A0ABT3B4C8_9CYAN|nr:hypothetical protein [Plectonema radiosum]MCV3216226.1 hypothetical protein [Plectonema radiosum NIES-515]